MCPVGLVISTSYEFPCKIKSDLIKQGTKYESILFRIKKDDAGNFFM
jgi:hypothetical protein